MADNKELRSNVDDQSSKEHLIDIDRMVNEGLGSGYVAPHNGLIEETTTDAEED